MTRLAAGVALARHGAARARARRAVVVAATTPAHDASRDGPDATSSFAASALASAPFTEREASVQGVRCSIRPIKDGIALTAEIDMPSAFLSRRRMRMISSESGS